MAILANIEAQGGLSVTGAYVRVRDIAVGKIEDRFILTYEIEAHKDKATRDGGGAAIPLGISPLQVVSDIAPSDIYAEAYADLKTRDAMGSVIDSQ